MTKLVIKRNKCGVFAPLITHYNNNAVKNQHMKQQTAVEYLFEQLWETPKDKLTWHTILNKAKEMEKDQHNKTSEDWWKRGAHYVLISAIEESLTFDEYYKKKFENK